jgi:UDP-N-acetylmuramate--alanine ligase
VRDERASLRDGLFALPRRVHLIGIRGAGMRGIAVALAAKGHRVTGSDAAEAPDSCRLAAAGIRVVRGHDAENLPADADLVIHSAAIREGNPELAEARRRSLPVVKYAEALGGLMALSRGIAVAGAHGKTTTTGLLAWTLAQLGADPTFVVGGEVPELGGSSRVGKGEFLVAEACEYDRSFHRLRPEVAIVTNIDEDHLDYYSDLAEITAAFVEFGRLLPPRGLLATLNEHGRTFLEARLPAPVVTVGIEKDADWVARDCAPLPGGTLFTARYGARDVARVRLQLPGYHNVLNALLVMAVSTHLGFDPEAAGHAMGLFRGVGRRFDVKWNYGDLVVVDDYAHHPAEIRACLASVRAAWPNARVWVVFQPHQASRTRFLLREFASALHTADRVVVPDIFFARDSEEERRRISSRDLVMKIRNLGTKAEHVPDFPEIEEYLLAELRPRDVLVTMGAGDVYRVADAIVARLKGFRSMNIPA